jgi:hypothetical protein
MAVDTFGMGVRMGCMNMIDDVDQGYGKNNSVKRRFE